MTKKTITIAAICAAATAALIGLVFAFGNRGEAESPEQPETGTQDAAAAETPPPAQTDAPATPRPQPEARIMQIFTVDGSVTMTRREDAAADARPGARLHEGYSVATGHESASHIRLDSDSLVRMDQRSEVSVSRASDSLLALNVESGQILLDIQNQHPGHETQVVAGNHVIGVRGTLFVAGLGRVIMLEGSAEVDGGIAVPAGYMANLDDAPVAVVPINFYEVDDFTALAAIDHADRVLGAGGITEEELDELIRRMNPAEHVETAEAPTPTPAPTSEPTPAPEATPAPAPIPEPTPAPEATPAPQATPMPAQTPAPIASPTPVPAPQATPAPTPASATIVLFGERISTTTTQLILRNRGISDLSPFAEVELPILHTLDLTGNSISDLSPLGGLDSSVLVSLGGNNISDLSPIAGWTRLSQLDLSNNSISDLSPLAELTSLQSLFLSDNNISDLSPLSGLTTSLREINLRNNNISDLSPLVGLLTNLSRVDLAENNITDISPLAGLTDRTILIVLEDNNITDWSPVAHVRNVQGRPWNWMELD